MRSMTGFAQERCHFGQHSLYISFKSLNNRYLEINFKGTGVSPETEKLIRELLKDRVHRGKIDVIFDLFEQNPNKWDIQLNETLLEEILDKLHAFRKKYRESVSVSMDALLKIPMLFHLDYVAGESDEAELQQIRAAAEKVLERFIASREQEGAFILQDLLPSLDGIDRYCDQIALQAESAEAEIYASYRKKIEKLVNGLGMDEKRIAQEAAITAEKCSIAEEINRLKTHNLRLRALLLDPAVPTKGREADFLTQEMQRETHTIAAKTASLEIHQQILYIRREIDKLRQQVQNIE